MWRTQAVERMLLEDVAGLGRRELEDRSAAALLATARRAVWRAVTLDWCAIVILLAVRFGEEPVLSLGPSVDAVFSIGLLAVAVHSGFRLGQLEKLRAVGLLTEELTARSRMGSLR